MTSPAVLPTESANTSTLRRAAIRATLAPSVHNTQPWRFELRGGELTLHADRARQLRVLDPSSRQLMISCGCALFNARVTIAAAGLEPVVDRQPDPARPDLMARLSGRIRTVVTGDALARYDQAIEVRQTNRRRFSTDDVPSEVVERLEAAAYDEGAGLLVVTGDEQRGALTVLTQRADDIQLLNPAYRAELRAWTSDDPRRADGISPMAVPRVDGTAHDEIPMRDFDTRGAGWLPAGTHSSNRQCLLLLWTGRDDPASWLRAGEALERVLLEATLRGYAASPLTQVVEVATTRAALRQEFGMTGYPHVLLRVGRAPLTPRSRRRRLVDVLVEKP